MSATLHPRMTLVVGLVLGIGGGALAQSSGKLATIAAALAPPLRAQSEASVWDGVYTVEQSKRGDKIYQQDCVTCHGPTLEGGEMAPGLADGLFKENWNGLTVGDLFDRIQESMPPDDPGKLSRQEIADVLARVLSANKMPAGDKELADRPEMLRRILFDPFRQ